MSSRNIRLLLSYDGTDFNGWQVQPGGRTVQGVIEEALGRMHKKKTALTGAGRTDSGVHARGQVANFFTCLDSMTVDTFTPALNALLPMDVRILKSCEAPPDFHARRDARRRTYRYYMNPGSFLYPWERRYCLALFRKPDLSLLNAMAECFIGVHDFTAFCRDDVKQKSTTRQVSCSAFFYQGNSLVYQISGNAFLWKMVRSIVGTILEFEKAGRSAADVAAVLAGKRRKEAGITAPAYPLFLHHIEYGDRE